MIKPKNDIQNIFSVLGFFAPSDGMDAETFYEEQDQAIELGLFKLIFWNGINPEDIVIETVTYRGLNLMFFNLNGEKFLGSYEEREPF